MVRTRSGHDYITIFGREVYYASDTESEDAMNNAFEESWCNEESLPSYDYVMGENLVEDDLPRYWNLYEEIPSYQDVLDMKKWEQKLLPEKKIREKKAELKNLMNELKMKQEHLKIQMAKIGQEIGAITRRLRRGNDILRTYNEDILLNNININNIFNEHRKYEYNLKRRIDRIILNNEKIDRRRRRLN